MLAKDQQQLHNGQVVLAHLLACLLAYCLSTLAQSCILSEKPVEHNVIKMIFYYLIASSPKQPPESHESTDLICLQVGLQLYEMWVRLLPNLINLLLSV